MWERAEYQNGDVKIQTKLLNIAVAFATDDDLVRVTNYKKSREKKILFFKYLYR